MVQKLSITPDDLKKVVEFIVPLEKSGDRYNGYCPFCSNKGEPRFIYNANKAEWRCYECKSNGNVIDLVQQYYKATKQEAKGIIKTTITYSHKNTNKKTSNSAVASIPENADTIRVCAEIETTDISEENDISSSLIDEMTGLVMTLRSIKGYLGMVLSSDNKNICSKIPEGMDENIISSIFKFNDFVKARLHKTWKEYSVDPIEILLAGNEFRILLVQTSVEERSNLKLCLFIDKDSTPSMFQLQIKKSLMRIRNKEA